MTFLGPTLAAAKFLAKNEKQILSRGRLKRQSISRFFLKKNEYFQIFK